MNKEKIIEVVQEILDSKPEIDELFYPLIKAFFVRLQEQYNLNEKELFIYLNRFKKIKKFLFTSECYYGGNSDPKISCDKNSENIKYEPQIYFNTQILSYALSGNENKIEEFIDLFFHEMTHLVQIEIDSEKFITGFHTQHYHIENGEVLYDTDSNKILNEFATIINARRITYGIADGNYSEYEEFQLLARAAINSLGLDDYEISELQMKGSSEERKK